MIALGSRTTLPPVHELAAQLVTLFPRVPPPLITKAVRQTLEQARENLGAEVSLPAERELLDRATARLRSWMQHCLKPVINATGVVLHTNLGRAPLGHWRPYAGYTNLEFDLPEGKRGKRDVHAGAVFELLLGKPAIAVNNGAAALFLAANELAAGFEVIVSRGELIEIGDGFRIPDILVRSGVTLREVGTANRTRIEDYRDAINERTRMLLRVHPSNFHITGFTGTPALEDLAALGRERGIPTYHDLGSGNVTDLRAFGITEPLVIDSIKAGIDLVSFSGDKLFGGPQAGILAGDPGLIARLRRNPLFRALRIDKLTVELLENTARAHLLQDWDAIPALRMIRQSAAEIESRSRNLFPDADLIEGESVIGGGSTPDQSIPTVLIVAARKNVKQAADYLRTTETPVIARVSKSLLLLDLRTVFRDEEPTLKNAVLALDQARS